MGMKQKWGTPEEPCVVSWLEVSMATAERPEVSDSKKALKEEQ